MAAPTEIRQTAIPFLRNAARTVSYANALLEKLPGESVRCIVAACAFGYCE